MYRLILLALLFASCSPDEICGEVTGGGVDRWNGMLYLEIDGSKEYVDMKTYDSYFIGDLVCLE